MVADFLAGIEIGGAGAAESDDPAFAVSEVESCVVTVGSTPS
jgi:hypothetical protein